jgi:MFS family permease
LRHRNFRLLWTGNLATQAGYWMNTVAVGWLVFDKTESAAMLGLSGFVSGIPLLLFSLVGGVLADRVNRWKLLMLNQLTVLLIALAYALLLTFGLLHVWHILTLSFLYGITQSINVPTRQALVSTLVPRDDLVNAISLHSVGMNSMRIIAPAIAGVLIGSVGVVACYWIQAAGCLWALANVWQMRVPPQAHTNRAVSPLRNLTDGVRYLFSDATLLGLMMLVAVPTIFAFPYQQLLPLFAEKILNVGATGLGMLTSAVGIGALVSALVVASAAIQRKGWWLALVIVIYGAAIAAFAVSPWFGTSLLALAAGGMTWSAASALCQTLLQTHSKPEYVGRIMSVYALTWGLQPLGNLIIGGAAEYLTAPIALGLGGVASVIGTLLVLWWLPQICKLS